MYVCVSGGYEMFIFWKILRTYQMNISLPFLSLCKMRTFTTHSFEITGSNTFVKNLTVLVLYAPMDETTERNFNLSDSFKNLRVFGLLYNPAPGEQLGYMTSY